MNATLQQLHRALSARAVMLFAVMAMAMTTVVGVAWPVGVAEAQEPSSAVMSELNQWTTRHDQVESLLRSLRKEREGLEPRYRSITAKVEKLKRAGSTGLQLEQLLEDGKVLSEKLYGVQKRIRDTEGQRTRIRERIVALYDMLIAQTHQDVVNPMASDSSRGDAIARINKLKAGRYTFASAPAATPDLNITNLKRLMEDPIDDPEEAAAQAAEVDDADRKIRKQIKDLDDEIVELRRLKQTRTKAQDFRDQEGLFDESTPGGRRVARGSQGARSQSDTDRGQATGEESGGTVTTASDSDSGEEFAVGNEAEPNNMFDGDGAMGSPPEAEPGGGVSDDDFGDGTVGGTDATQDPSRDQNVPGSAVGGPVGNVPTVNLPNDPFGGPGVVVRSDADPSRFDGVARPSANESLDQQIERLKREKERKERESKQLQRRSEQLKKIADE